MLYELTPEEGLLILDGYEEREYHEWVRARLITWAALLQCYDPKKNGGKKLKPEDVIDLSWYETIDDEDQKAEPEVNMDEIKRRANALLKAYQESQAE